MAKWTKPSKFKALRHKLKQLQKQINTSQRSNFQTTDLPHTRTYTQAHLWRYNIVNAYYGIKMSVIAIDMWHCSFISHNVKIQNAGALLLPTKSKKCCLTCEKNNFMHKAFRHVEYVNTKYFWLVRSCSFVRFLYVDVAHVLNRLL